MAPVLRRLDSETFGWKLRRARDGLVLREVADFISDRAGFVSFASLSRLEFMAEPPPDRKRRALACLAALTYGFDPIEFGLSTDDVPSLVDINAFVKAAASWRETAHTLRNRSSGCLTGDERSKAA